MHLLVVDDDRDIQTTLMEVFLSEGYLVGEIADGMLAFAYLNPHIVILDYQKRRRDGEIGMRLFPEEQRFPLQLAYLLMSAKRGAYAPAFTAMCQEMGVLWMDRPLDLAQLLKMTQWLGHHVAQHFVNQAC
jgi:DNA-binding response OmpR family regulator